jgi:hypothetical protein
VSNNEVLGFQFGERFVGLEITNVKGFYGMSFQAHFWKKVFPFVCVWFQFAKGNLIWRKVKSSNLVLV